MISRLPVSRLLLSATALLALVSMAAPGASNACDKHLKAHAADSETPAQAASR